jgi:uncharacterized protein (TIGR02001 family)
MSDRTHSRRLLATSCIVVLCLPRCLTAAESFGGSLAVTSDYLVRGISRSDHDAALQGDVHLSTDGGFVGGVFASNAQFDSSDHRSAEFSGFVGFSWQIADTWRAKLLASYYGYAWNDSGSRSNYAEFGAEAAYDEWLEVAVVYSPHAPRYVAYYGLTGVGSESAEVTVRSPWRRRVAAVAGVGYSSYRGSNGGGYAYWSAGGVVDLAPVSVSLNYVSTGTEAANLFFNAAAHNRWTATVLWRF